MENNQSTQHQPSKPNHPSRSRLSSGSNSLLNLLLRHPWLVWSGAWVLLLSAAALTSSIAILSIMDTGQIAHEEQQPPPVVGTPSSAPIQNSETSSIMPSWVLSAVALTFTAAGYLVVSKRLNSLLQSPKLSKPAKHSSTRVPKRRQRQRHLLQELPPASTPPEPIPAVTLPVSTAIEPMVTVLPPEENHPLDESQESLAEMMDIRKQRPLSSILGETPSNTNS